MTHEKPTPAPVEVTQLKPCPFCGSAAKIIAPLGYGNVRASECSNSDCAATGPWAANQAEAIAAWNTRHSAPAGEVAMQHVAYFDEGQFHWMSGIAPRDCELYAKWSGHTAPVTHPAPPADLGELVEAVAELQLAAFLAGRGSIVTKDDGRTRQSKPGPAMDDYRSMARAALAKHTRAQGEG